MERVRSWARIATVGMGRRIMQEMFGMASVGLGNGSNVRGGRGRIQHASGFELAAGELIGKHSRKKVRE